MNNSREMAKQCCQNSIAMMFPDRWQKIHRNSNYTTKLLR